MPRAASTPNRRAKQDTRPLARTAASVRATALADTAGPWRHPAELGYITTGWTDMSIIRLVAANVFSIAARPDSLSEAFIPAVLRSRPDFGKIMLPRSYRLPLLWVAKYASMSLRLVLTADPDILQQEWDCTKYELLHIARLCRTLLDSARLAAEGMGMEKGWRCPTFDRPLRRYWHKWLLQKDEFVREFWREFGEEEFDETDILRLPWSQWVLKGHAGFALTKAEVANGITADEFLGGLFIDDKDDSFEWRIGSVPGSGVPLNVGELAYLQTPISPPSAAASSFTYLPPIPIVPLEVPQRIPLPGELRRQRDKDGLRIKTEALSNAEQLLAADPKGKQKQVTEDADTVVTNTQPRNAYPSPPTDTGSSRGGSSSETRAVAPRTPGAESMEVDGIDTPQDEIRPPSPVQHPPAPFSFAVPSTGGFKTRMGSLAPGRQIQLPKTADEDHDDEMADAPPPVMKSEPMEFSLVSAGEIFVLDDDDPELSERELGYPDEDDNEDVDVVRDSVSGTGLGVAGTRSISTLSSLSSLSASAAPSRSRSRSGSQPPVTGSSWQSSSAEPTSRPYASPSPLRMPYTPTSSTGGSSSPRSLDDRENYTLSSARFQFPPIEPPPNWMPSSEAEAENENSLQSNGADRELPNNNTLSTAPAPDWIDTLPAVILLREELHAMQGRVGLLEAELQVVKGQKTTTPSLGSWRTHPLGHLLTVSADIDMDSPSIDIDG
ncbi:hypothetical protein C8F01DRAFT_1145608 [Mycena amicta]|nr:hypothetical protein C8F01DRAFT_1145608 [Mycena amicta]